jgi:hypothetical protein
MMAEQKTAQQQVREQFKVAENNIQNIVRVWNEALFATTEWSFDLAERSLRYNQELRSQNERTFNEALANYRSLYQDGLKSWQGYVHSITEIASRT